VYSHFCVILSVNKSKRGDEDDGEWVWENIKKNDRRRSLRYHENIGRCCFLNLWGAPHNFLLERKRRKITIKALRSLNYIIYDEEAEKGRETRREGKLSARGCLSENLFSKASKLMAIILK
jgi:hypothetical protein